MIFWLAVLVGGLFAWIAVQIGFYAAWIMFFNLLLSAYVALFLTPVIVSTVPAAIETTFGYGYGLVLMTVAIATLLIAYGMCFACLSGQLRAEFPKAFDNIGAGLLGFLTGFLVCSFVAFAVALTPLAHIDSIKPLGLDAPSQKTNTSYVCWWCDKLHSLVSSSGTPLATSQQAVSLLLARPGAPAAGGPGRGAPAEPGEGKPPSEVGPSTPAKSDAEEAAAKTTENPQSAGARPEPNPGGAAPANEPTAPAGRPRRPAGAPEEEPASPPRGEKAPSTDTAPVRDPFAPSP